MRITTRVASGYALLATLIAAVLFYQALIIHRMQAINRDLSSITFRATLISLDLMRHRDLIEEYCRKYFAIYDPDYLKLLRAYEGDFEASLKAIRTNVRSRDEHAAVGRLTNQWIDFTAALNQFADDPNTRSVSALPANLSDLLERLRTATAEVYEETLRTIELEVARSRFTGEKARIVSWSVAGSAFLVSLIISLWIARSVSQPLKRLTEGTRAIAGGDFTYRLDDSMNDEFSQVARDFNAMSHRLNELDQLKKDFVSHVTHEIKNPLASMQETIELLLEEIPGPLSDKQKRLLKLNLKSGKRLSSMIGNLLDLSRMEAGVMEYEFRSQDLVPLLQAAMEEFEVQAQEKKIQIHCSFSDPRLAVECDGDRIIQVVANLISNAIKFSPPMSTIEVRAEPSMEGPPGVVLYSSGNSASASQRNGLAVVSVSDSGTGVPDAEKARIFQKFHQARRPRLSGQGAGLGLAICRTIIEAHHGVLWVEDNPKGGSIFRFTLLLGGGDESLRRGASTPI